MMPPGSMEDDPPMGAAMPMEDDPPMDSSMSDPAAAMQTTASKEGCAGSPNSEMGSMGRTGPGGNAPSAATTPSQLPGFIGTPGVYHMGATGFFLDHPEHITLSTEQRTALESIKVKAERDQAVLRQQIEKAEGEVWALTGSERPDSLAIDAKIRTVEKLRSQKRLAYIQLVGEAAKVLTEDQRKQLAGLEQVKPAAPVPAPGAPGAGK